MSDKATTLNRLRDLTGQAIVLAEKTPHSLMALLMRFGIAGVFWKSGLTKLAFDNGKPEGLASEFLGVLSFNWTISDSAYMLFQYEYDVPLLPYEFATHMATAAELIFPVLLVFGLFTRFAALSLLGMTAVIQIFVYPHLWLVHALWAGVLLYLLARGAGLLSLDRPLRNTFL